MGERVGVWAAFLGRTALQPRALSAPAGATSILIGMAAAGAARSKWNWSIVILGIVAAATANLVALLVNDLADRVADDANDRCIPGFSGGTRALQSGLVGRREMLTVVAVLVLTSAATAILLTSITSLLVLVLGALALLGGLTYSSGPRLVSRGFGDLMLGLCAGLAPVLGGWIAMGDQLDGVAWIVGCAQALTTGSVCFALHSLDAEADAAAGKRTLAARVPTNRLPLAVAAIHVPALMATGVALAVVGMPAPLSTAVVAAAVVLTCILAASRSVGRVRLASWVCTTYQCGSIAVATLALARSGAGLWLVPVVLALGSVAVCQAGSPLRPPLTLGDRTPRSLAPDALVARKSQ